MDVVTSFAQLVAHVVHDESIQLVHCLFPNETLNVERCQELGEGVVKLVSVLHANSSFNAMELVLEERVVTIFDEEGVGRDDPVNFLTNWQGHIVNILRRCYLFPLTRRPVWEQTGNVLRLVAGNGIAWTLQRRGSFLERPDGFSCGPLALLRVLHIFGLIDDQTIASLTQATMPIRPGSALTNSG